MATLDNLSNFTFQNYPHSWESILSSMSAIFTSLLSEVAILCIEWTKFSSLMFVKHVQVLLIRDISIRSEFYVVTPITQLSCSQQLGRGPGRKE